MHGHKGKTAFAHATATYSWANWRWHITLSTKCACLSSGLMPGCCAICPPTPCTHSPSINLRHNGVVRRQPMSSSRHPNDTRNAVYGCVSRWRIETSAMDAMMARTSSKEHTESYAFTCSVWLACTTQALQHSISTHEPTTHHFSLLRCCSHASRRCWNSGACCTKWRTCPQPPHDPDHSTASQAAVHQHACLRPCSSSCSRPSLSLGLVISTTFRALSHPHIGCGPLLGLWTGRPSAPRQW
jgi:hypothetical protein